MCLDPYSNFKVLYFLEIPKYKWSSIHFSFVFCHSLNLRRRKSFVFIEFFHTASSKNSLKFQKITIRIKFYHIWRIESGCLKKVTWIMTFQTFSFGIMSEIIIYTATRLYFYTYLYTCIKRNIYSFPYLISPVTFLSNV